MISAGRGSRIEMEVDKAMGNKVGIGKLLVLLFVGILLCTNTAFGKTKLHYRYNFYGGQIFKQEAMEEIVQTFNRSHPEIEVEAFAFQISGGSAYDQLVTLIISGAAPDVVEIENSAVIEFASRGLLEPLDELYTREKLLADFWPADAMEDIWRGRVWGIPKYTNVRGLVWNVGILDEIGMNSSRGPTTWLELEQLTRKGMKTDADGSIVRMGFVPFQGSYAVGGWLWAFGGGIYDWNTGEPILEAEANVRAWEWMQEWTTRYPPQNFRFATRGTSGAHGNFLAGCVAAVTAADNGAAQFLTLAPDLGFLTGRVPFPEGGRNGTWGGGLGWAIPRGSTRNKREAIAFMQWLATEGALLNYAMRDEFPTNRAVAQKVIRTLKSDDKRIPMLNQMDERNPRPPLWSNVHGRLTSVFNSSIIGVSRGNPREALANLQREFVPLYEAIRLGSE
jgi:ABC-type glycerol-3-phosphate transport system substrate-binding protein